VSIGGKLKAFAEMASNLFRRPETVPEAYGFTSENFRWLPRRDEDKCTGCGACNERCSSGATSIKDEGENRIVSIDSLQCIFCGRCADVCPEGALDLLIPEKIADSHDPDAQDKNMRRVSLSHGSEEKKATVDTTLKLQRCTVCGEIMPVTEKYLAVVKERTLKNLKPETAAIVEKDMERYLKACINCRRKHSIEWDTHPRKFI
jgi:formate hydrogenlyase subunit 6/NADH:ubiquinone oxidoreductase subunit I